MKILALMGVLFFFPFEIMAQNYKTEYSRSTTSDFCGEDSFVFILGEETITRIDNYDGVRKTFYSKKESGGYESDGFYSELWTCKFYLNKYGITQFNRIEQYTYRVTF